MASSKTQFANRLLAGLPRDVLALLQPHLKQVALPLRRQLELPNKPVEHLYFVAEGIASVVAVTRPATTGEVGLIGSEGVSGLAVILGDSRSPHSIYMQVGGSGHRIESATMRAAMNGSPQLRSVVLRYAQSFMIQIAHTAVANSNAPVAQRLARWLLMAHDRVGGNEINLTHEFLALMLGTRRPGVTEALHALAQLGMISTKRKTIVLMDRSGLETYAGRYYGIPESEYARMIGASPARRVR
jgi:CRP-like cAMP-binding protein